MIKGLVKGDSIELEITVNEDLTGCNLRCEIFDNSAQSIKLGSSGVTGGDDTQIEITSTSSTESVFLVKVDAGETTNFADNAHIEIERETAAGAKLTILQDKIQFKKEEITWTDVT